MLAWRLFGTITLCDKGLPQFSEKLPKEPGLYWIKLKDGRCYIGEAGDLNRRLQEYRHPTPGIEQEYRIHTALIAATEAELWVYMEGNMSDKSVRCRLERAEIETALKEGAKLLNHEGPSDAARLHHHTLLFRGGCFKNPAV